MGDKTNFLGVGFLGPLSLSEGRGIAMSSAEQNVEQSVRLILSTRIGERCMRPNFGCRIHEYVFAPNNAGTHLLIREAVRNALALYESRIENVEVDVVPDPKQLDRLNVNVKYKIVTVNSNYNLVYPFYLQGS